MANDDRTDAVKIIDARSQCAGSNQLPTGDQIKKVRSLLQLTQSNLAHRMTKSGLPISQTEVSKLESGHESTPKKYKYKETHNPTKPKFLGKGYHGYRDRIRIFLARHGIIFIDETIIIIVSTDDVFYPIIEALKSPSTSEIFPCDLTEEAIEKRSQDYDEMLSKAMIDAVQWLLPTRYNQEKHEYANGMHLIDMQLPSEL